MEKKESIKKEIWNLHRKADQNRTMHGHIKGYYSIFSKIVLGYVSIGSAIVAMLIFADIEDDTQFLIGIASASIFITGLIPTTFSFESKILERGVAVKLWGTWIRTASNFCNTEIDTLDEVTATKRANDVIERYKTIMNETPSIPDRKFNRLKQKHIQKIEISKALDKKPFSEIRTIKKSLKAKSDKVSLE